MRSISGKINDRRIHLPVSVFASRDPVDLTNDRYVGLLDTGATTSLLSRAVIDRFSLSPVGRKRLVAATDTLIRDTYCFRLGLVGDGQADTALPIVFAETVGFRIDQASGFDVLLGMDVLSQTDFTMKRKGHWRLSFG